MEIVISILASTSYFFFSPLSYKQGDPRPNQPDHLGCNDCFFGGVAGIIGASKKK
ncbi:MAG: hypothetical protein ACLSH6_07090 [Limosilactobacillus pontis]